MTDCHTIAAGQLPVFYWFNRGSRYFLLVVPRYLPNLTVIVQESLSLLIKYQLLREGKSYHSTWFQSWRTSRDLLEVESLVAEAVQTVVVENPAWLPHSDLVVGKLIEALEADASWVELFGATGELNVPDKKEQELVEPLQRAKEVYCFRYWMNWRSCFTRSCVWIDIATPHEASGGKSRFQLMCRR